MVDQRKIVTVVFADLVESTSLAERVDPEVLAGILRRYFNALQAAIETHGGTVEKFIGDAVVGVFGIPVLHEDDALRAVRAGLALEASLRELNREIATTLGSELVVRVGINTGEVVVSSEGALGHAISMAARLEQHASPGEILIGKATFELVKESTDVDALESLTVKGSTTPMEAWRVRGFREPARRGSAARSGYVGRARELQLIASAFESAINLQACVSVTVLAPPGLGKSRLLAEATSPVSDQAHVIGGACLPYGEQITYAPLIEAVRQLEAAEGADVLDRLAVRQPDGEQVIARVRATMAGAASGSPDETAWAFRRLFEALAMAKPLVLILDDLHWADPLLLDLVEYLMTFSVSRPILLLCAARPDLLQARPTWMASAVNSRQLRLAPLTTSETEGLLASLDSARLDEQTRRQIVESAAGVPLFVEQMAAFDVEGSEIVVPPTVRALLAARVDSLPREERSILELAAIEGVTFHRDMLVELVEADERDSLGSRLMVLIRRDFIQPQPELDGRDGFAFNHALIRDAVYEAMPRRTRASLHERLAVVRQRRGEGSDETIGYHLEQAYRERLALNDGGEQVRDLARRAGLALAAAGRSATARKESARAIALLSRSSELLRDDPAERAHVLPDLIDALVAAGDIARAQAIRDEAVELATQQGDETSLLRAEMAWAMIDARTDAAGWQHRVVNLSERAIDHFSPLDDHVNLAVALLLQGVALGTVDRARSIEVLEQAHQHAMRADNERVQVETWDELGGSMLFGPTPHAEVLEFVRGESEWARNHGIAFSVADARLGEAYSLAALARYDEALTVLSELIEFFAQLPGQTSQHGECYALAGRIERDRGNPEGAITAYRRAMELFETSSHWNWWRNAAPGVAHALLDLDRVAEARQVLDAIRAQEEASIGAPRAFGLEAEARYHVRVGDVVGGLDIARQAVSAVADTGAPLYEGRSRENLANLLALAGDADGAREEFVRARALYVAKGYLPGTARIDSQPGSIAPRVSREPPPPSGRSTPARRATS